MWKFNELGCGSRWNFWCPERLKFMTIESFNCTTTDEASKCPDPDAVLWFRFTNTFALLMIHALRGFNSPLAFRHHTKSRSAQTRLAAACYWSSGSSLRRVLLRAARFDCASKFERLFTTSSAFLHTRRRRFMNEVHLARSRTRSSGVVNNLTGSLLELGILENIWRGVVRKYYSRKWNRRAWTRLNKCFTSLTSKTWISPLRWRTRKKRQTSKDSRLMHQHFQWFIVAISSSRLSKFGFSKWFTPKLFWFAVALSRLKI